jgi:hypothetical protein
MRASVFHCWGICIQPPVGWAEQHTCILAGGWELVDLVIVIVGASLMSSHCIGVEFRRILNPPGPKVQDPKSSGSKVLDYKFTGPPTFRTILFLGPASLGS